jgi:hypothetical protein
MLVTQLLYDLLLLALPAYLLAVGDGWGVIFVSALLGVPSIIGLIGWFGLRNGRLWGWCVDLLSNLMLLGILTYSMIDDGLHNFEWEVAGLTFFSFAASVCLLVPTVRKFYWQSNATQAVQLSS